MTDRRTTLFAPRTGEAFASVRIDDQHVVAAAVERAAAAFESWKRTTPSQRQTALLRLADAIEAHAVELAEAEAQNTGKKLSQVLDEEIPSALDELRFMAGALRAVQGPIPGEYADSYHSALSREPAGICALIVPWNYPLAMTISKLGPAVAMGNTVVIKPAETTPSSAQIVERLCTDIFPDGVVNFVYGDRETGRSLATHSTPTVVSLTGSTRAGQEVAAEAAKTLKQVHLELGGKAPAIVFADADLDQAVDGIIEGAFYNAGQDCTAATRILVDESIYTVLLHRLLTRIKDVDIDPLNSHEHLERVAGFVDRLPDEARIESGGLARTASAGFFFEPTLITGVEQHHEIVQEEVFGPILTVQTFLDESEAIALANGVAYGLAASIWTTDRARSLRVPTFLDAGTVWVNCHGVWASEMPHGGFKKSGYGKELSIHAFDAYSRLKHTVHNM